MQDPAEIIHELREALKWQKEHAEALDKNWETLNRINVGAFQKVLEMPDASIPEMIDRIQQLKSRASATASTN